MAPFGVTMPLTHLLLVQHIDMRRWTGSPLARVMACRLSGTKPLPEPMLAYGHLDPWEQTPVKFDSKYKTFFINENTFENVVCGMVGIFFRDRWQNEKYRSTTINLELTHQPLNKMVDILKTAISFAFFDRKKITWFKLHLIKSVRNDAIGNRS